jgi:hypothetical protein
MIEETLAQYGILGLWTITLLTERFMYNKKIQAVVENNTVAITKVYEVMDNCSRKRKI